MEFRTLRYFIAIADAGSITTAADILHVTQPTLSDQMKELEEELGKKLFSRAKKGSRRLELTEEGLILRRRADEILEIVRKTELEISSEGGAVKGDVYIGMGEAGSLERIIRIIDSIQAEHPCIRFHFYSGNAPDVLDKLDKGLTDFAVVFIESPHSYLMGYDPQDVEKGGNGYIPISLQYSDYTATHARKHSIAGGDPFESFTDRSYQGKTAHAINACDLSLLQETRRRMGNKPVVLVLMMSNPTVMQEIEPLADAILVMHNIITGIKFFI